MIIISSLNFALFNTSSSHSLSKNQLYVLASVFVYIYNQVIEGVQISFIPWKTELHILQVQSSEVNQQSAREGVHTPGCW